MSTAVLPTTLQEQPSAAVMAAFTRQGGQVWSDVVAIDWAREPLSEQARSVAGTARDFTQFYAGDQRSVALAVEQYLTRHSLAVHAGR